MAKKRRGSITKVFSSSYFSPPGCLIDRSAYVSRQITKVCCMTCRRYRKAFQERPAREHARFCCWLSRSCDASSGLSSLSCTLFMALTLQQRCHKSYTEEKKRWESWQETSSKCAVKALLPSMLMLAHGYSGVSFFFYFFSFSFFFLVLILFIFYFFSLLFIWFTTMYQVGKTLLVNEVSQTSREELWETTSAGSFDHFLSASPYSAIIQVNLSFPSHTTIEELTSLHRHWSSWFNRFSPRARRHWKSGNIGWSRGWKEMANWWQIWSLIWSLWLVCISSLPVCISWTTRTLQRCLEVYTFLTNGLTTSMQGRNLKCQYLKHSRTCIDSRTCFIGFISSLACKERPLVIFLDDLQCNVSHSPPPIAPSLSPFDILFRYSLCFHFHAFSYSFRGGFQHPQSAAGSADKQRGLAS